MIKNIIAISIFLVSFQLVLSNSRSKEYYLLDDLNLEELSSYDLSLVDSCLKVFRASENDSIKIESILHIVDNGQNEKVWQQYNEWLYTFIKKALNVENKKSKKRYLKRFLSNTLTNKGFIQSGYGNTKEALAYYSQGLKISEEIKDRMHTSVILNNMGLVYEELGKTPIALEYYDRSLNISKELSNKQGIATTLNNIADIHDRLEQDKKALSYYQSALETYRVIGDKEGEATALNNCGYVYSDLGDDKLAKQFWDNALGIYKEINNKSGIATVLNNIGRIYEDKNNNISALKCYNQSLVLCREINERQSISLLLIQIARIEFKRENLNEALRLGEQSLAIAKKIGLPSSILNASELLSTIYEETGKDDEALTMFKLSILMKDSLNKIQNHRAAVEQQAKYEYEKQKLIDDTDYEKKMAVESEKKEKQRLLTYVISAMIVLVCVFLIFLFHRLRITRRQKRFIEKQKVEVEASKQEVEQSKALLEKTHTRLEEKNSEITDSIAYAKQIQTSILPSDKTIKNCIPKSFVLYRPKDIVAGDFYWVNSIEGKKFFAVADCTGHGVPGALVSVVCNNALNRSVYEYSLTTPGEILTKTREIVVKEFEKSEEDVRDGMDIALCVIEKNKLFYSGANNPVWIIRDGELIEYKANKQPIGKCDNPTSYNTITHDLKDGDTIYIFSDGYADQFGGDKGKKLKVGALRRLLLNISDNPIEKQSDLLSRSFDRWKGRHEQVDDLCMIGVKF